MGVVKKIQLSVFTDDDLIVYVNSTKKKTQKYKNSTS